MKMKQRNAPLMDVRFQATWRPMKQMTLPISKCGTCMDTGFIRHAMRKKNAGGYYHVYKKCPLCNRS